MTKRVTRRRFIKGSAAVGAAATFGGGLFGGGVTGAEIVEAPAGLAVATGLDGWANTMAAVEAVGGIAGFVPAGSTVAINANTAFKHRGSIVAPGVLLAVLELCAEAGASDVWLLKEAKEGFWKRCDRAEKQKTVIDAARVSERDYEVVKIDRGLALKEAHVDRHWLTADVVLNVTLAKHHKGCDYTGALKNTMGTCPHDPTCRFFHVGSKPDSEDWYPDMAHMSQCIADLNTVRKPDLTILDAGEILLQRRTDTDMWGLPGGSVELDETAFEALKREVAEETSLAVLEAEPMALYCGPDQKFVFPNGDCVQCFAVAFIVRRWEGTGTRGLPMRVT